MVYLDYSSTTKISYEAIEAYNKIEKDNYGVICQTNKLGEKAFNEYKKCIKEIADSFNIMESEITFTSGATEANNLALIGTLLGSHKEGNHIIVSKLEHQSIYKICNYLEKLGFEVDYVNNDQDGLIDFEDLKRLIRPDTILVSICALNKDLGIRQPLKMIRQIIKKENPNTLFHSDMAQAIGKISVNLHDVDLASISSHKLFGPKSMGLLYHSERIKIVPLMFGSNNELSPITLSLPSVVAFKTALLISLNDIDKREHFVSRLNEKICNELVKYDRIKINKTKYSIPHILSLSLDGLNASLFGKMLSDEDVFVKSSHNEINSSILSVYDDNSRIKDVLRISLSYKTTTEEINKFIEIFKKVYNTISLGE